MVKSIKNARRIYKVYRDAHGDLKLIPIRGLYVARRIDENGDVILTPYDQDDSNQDDNNQ
jgi:hypothetical protein